MSLSRIISRLAADQAEQPAVICGAAAITYRELDRRTNQLARSFAQRGVTHGDMVTIALPNSIEFYLALVATWKLGATPQPVSWQLPEHERASIVELAEPKLVVGADVAGWPSAEVALAGDASTGLDDSALPDAISPAWKAMTSGGSTGTPKLIVAEQPGVFPPEPGAAFGMRPGDQQLVAGPLYHNGPLLFSTLGLCMGHTLIVLEKFRADAALEMIARHRVSWLMLVPTMMSRILRAVRRNGGRDDLSALRAVWHMAAPCPNWLKQAWIDLVGPDVLYELYATTEGVAATAITGREWLDHKGSVGKPVLGEIVILDSAGEPVPPGTVGEIFMRSAEPSYRYIGARTRRVDGWESVGDLGWLDTDGFLYISDRRTDMIVSGGANIYPAEVEGAIEAHPLVGSCVVVGIPDDDLGQRVHAVIQTYGELSESELLGQLAGKLVRYKIPRSVEFVSKPLRDDAGKVRRSEVRATAIARMYITEHGPTDGRGG
ncbi:bile acid-coenzyme A ligase [Tamaricihabitans halophyticus]|uniref:Bile acid-coenzyme A ligase n=2 Tax=Tamaricihabitans halophyticus TaxID=1262583 RepID=A0A4R2QWY7_9PSEU|nr:bile acid-coenzyme A ligase [Tamaricihabitans halophyticus]